MSEHDPNTLPPEAESEDEDVEAHLLKEALASGAAAASMFAGTAAAMPVAPGAGGGPGAVLIDPGTGQGGAQNVDPGTGQGGAQVGNPGGGGAPGQVTDPGGGSAMAAKKHAPAKKAKPKSKVHKHQGSSHTTPPNKPPLQPEG